MKITHAPVLFSLILLLILGACQPEPYLRVSPSSLSFSEEGGTQTVQVSANYAWTVNVSGKGVSVSPSSGEGDGSVTVTVSPTNEPEPVTANLVFFSEGLSSSVELHQAARNTIMVGNVAKIPSEGGIFEVPVQYNTDFTVEVESDAKSWISFVETKALTSGKLVFDVEENVQTDPRTGKVTVKDKSGKADPITITLVQEEKKVIEVGDVTKIATEGGTYEVKIEYNTEFSVEVEESAQEWIQFVETKALTSGRLVFFFKANETPDARSGKVTIRDKSGKVEPIVLTFVQEEKKVIEVGDVTEIPAEGGTFEVKIAYNTEFSVEVEKSAQSWISFVETKALTSGQLVFVFAENEKPDARTGKVTIKDKSGKVEAITLTFVQAEKKVIQVGDVTEIAAEGGTYEVKIEYNTEFSVEVEKSAQSWITFVETKALTSGQLVFVFAENEKTDARTGKVTIKDKSGKVEAITLTFVQAEKKVIEVGEVTEIPQEGGTFEVEIQYNTEFTVEIEYAARSWISFVETKALTSGRLVFVFEENGDADKRSGQVTITDNNGKAEPITLTFVQEGTEPYFRVVCPEAESLGYEAGELTVVIEHNVGFSAYSWRDGASEVFDLDAMSSTWERHKCTLTIPYSRNTTRNVRFARVIFFGGEQNSVTYEFSYSDTLNVYQQPVTIIASDREVFVPAAASEFSFRVVENKTDNYRVEYDADWIELVKSQGKEGGAEYRWKTKENTGTGMRETQIRVFLNGFDEPDIFHVYQEGAELSVSVTYSGKKQVKAPSYYGPFPEKGTIWWGDGDSMAYSGGASHTYSTTGSHTVTVSTKYMHLIERAEVTDLEDGMHIDFSKMRNHNE